MADDVSIVVRVRDATRTGIASVNASLNRLARSTQDMDRDFGSMRSTALGLAPALIPIATAAAPIVASMGAAAVAVGAFGAALGPQIKAMGEAAEAETKYKDAVEEHGKASAEAVKAEQAYLAASRKLPPATREAAAGLSVLKDQYKDWSNSLSGDTMPVATKSFAVFGELFPKMTPLVKGTSAQLDRFVTLVAGGIRSPGFDRLMAKFSDFATGVLARANTGMVRLVQAMDSGNVGGSLGEFMKFAKENGPLVGETLKNVAQALTHLLVAAADTGVGLLTVINAFAGLVSAIPTELLTTLLQVAIAFKAVRLASAGMAVVAGHLTTAAASAAAFTRAAQFGGVSTAIAGVTDRLSAMQKASVVLAVIAAIAIGVNELAEKARGAPPDVDKLATSIKNLGQSAQFTGELKKTFGDMDGFIAKVNQLEQSSRELDSAKPFMSFLPGSKHLEGTAKKLDDLINGPSSFNAVSEDLKAFDEAFASMVQSGNAEKAAAGFRLTQAALLADGKTMDQVKALFPEYQAALEALAAEQKIAAEAMGVFGQQAIAVQGKLDAQKQSAEGLRQAIVNLNDANRAAYDSQIAFEAAIDSLTASFKEHGATLNMDTEAGRANATAMSQAAKAHDEMIAAGIGAGESLASMTGKSSKLREEMMRLATATFNNKEKAAEYVNTLLGAPGEIKTLVRLEKEEAITGLQAVQAEVRKTPGAKSVRVSTLNAAAIKALEAVGLKTRRLPDGRTEVYTANGQAIGAIASVAAAMNRLDGTSANTYVTTTYRIRGNPNVPSGTYYGSTAGRSADGNIYGQSYANGGVESHVAEIAQPTFRMWAEPETGGEAYIPLSPAKRGRSMAILDEVARRFGYRLERFANGGVSEILGHMQISPQWRKAGSKLTPFQKSFAQAGGVSELIATINEWKNKIKQATSGNVEKRLMNALSKTGEFLIKHQIALSKVNAALDGAKDKLKDLKDKAAQVRDQVASGITGSASITDGAQEGRPTSLGNIMANLQSKQRRSAEFAAMLKALQSRGLGGQAISEIASAGIDGGGFETAKALMKASTGSLQQINATQKQIAAAAADAGKTTANALYAAGIKAAEGLVKGLQAQQAKIVASMLNAARALEKAIKKAISGKASGGIIGAAGGGPRSGLTLVGEQGPELAELAPGSRVRSNPDSRRIAAGFAAGAGGGVIQVNLVLDGRVIARQLIDPFRAEIWDRAGGNVQKALGR